jgi:4-hydroxythreonine-4-phosphate dehydrogenase
MKIAITIGDAAGVGPEVILKALRHAIGDDVTPVVFGSRQVLLQENETLGDDAWADSELRSHFRACRQVGDVIDDGVSSAVVDVLPEEDFSGVEKGVQDTRCARLQMAAFKRAVEAAQAGEVDAVVTAPWNKSLFETIDEPAVGHTEVLADTFQTSQPVMMLAGPRLRVSLVTTHVPLRRVAGRLTRGRLRSVMRTTVGGLRRRFGIDHPEVAVCGLNPHAGEQGTMGDEEGEVIEPAIRELSSELGELATLQGPYPADTLFAKFRSGAAPFDAVVSMYHDQGLTPLKLLHFGESANLTLGLPIIRTSVDHGTAYDIAGRGIADAGSMRYAIELATDMARLEQNTP